MTRDPYAIWISEVMLQQTTVAAVIPYYERFLASLPTVQALADAPEPTVLRLWEGLGYYSRARNLRAAAKVIVSQFQGEFPRTVEQLASLPGIGRYTAGAIASFAWDVPAPIVEANTLRLYSRLIGLEIDPKSTAGQRRLWDFAARIVPRQRPSEINHALMDLGAMICLPREPQCDQCPLQSLCVARAQGREKVIPLLAARAALTPRVDAYLIVRRKNQVLLRQRSTQERWAGLWDFPRYELPLETPWPPGFVKQAARTLPFETPNEESYGGVTKIRADLGEALLAQTGIHASVQEPITEFCHTVTRFRYRVLCFETTSPGGTCRSGTKWIPLGDLHSYPLSRSARTLANLLMDRIA